MKNTILATGLLLTLLSACKTEGVKKVDANKQLDEKLVTDSLEMDLPVLESKALGDGIEMVWLEKGSGEAIADADVVNIDYKVRLADSTIIDGNHLLGMKYFPYLVGFGLQPKGWDIALRSCKIGDFVRIKLPAKMARGSKSVDGLIPANADNYLTVRILSKEAPTRTVDGNKIWIIKENIKNKTKFDENHQITFHTTISSPSSPYYFNSFAKNQPFTLRLEDYGVVPGLKKALVGAKKGDRMYVVVKSEDAYGAKGYVDVVKPNEDLFYNLLVLDVEK